MNLVETHQDEFRFILRLRHVATGLYLSHRGLVKDRNESLYAECGNKGIPIAELLDTIFSKKAIWLDKYDYKYIDFEIESSVSS